MKATGEAGNLRDGWEDGVAVLGFVSVYLKIWNSTRYSWIHMLGVSSRESLRSLRRAAHLSPTLLSSVLSTTNQVNCVWTGHCQRWWTHFTQKLNKFSAVQLNTVHLHPVMIQFNDGPTCCNQFIIQAIPAQIHIMSFLKQSALQCPDMSMCSMTVGTGGNRQQNQAHEEWPDVLQR